MKCGGPIHRKKQISRGTKGLRQTAIKRRADEVRHDQSAKTRRPRRRKRISQRSETNSHAGEDLVARRAYLAANPDCEITLLMDGKRIPASEVHHLWAPRRDDETTCMVSVARGPHDWAQQKEPTAGRILCLLIKARKGELRLARMRKITGWWIDGWLETDKVKRLALECGVENYRQELLRLIYAAHPERRSA